LFMGRFSFGTLRARLLLLALLATIPALVLILYTASEQRRLARTDAEKDARHLVRVIAHQEEILVAATRHLLIGLAQLSEVRGYDAKRCSAFVADLLKQYPLYANFGVTMADGSPYCSAFPIPAGVTPVERRWFQLAIQNRDFSVGDYQIGRITRRPVLVFGYPVLDEVGRVKAVLSASLDLAWLNQAIAEAQLPEGSVLSVVDANGTILARHPDPMKSTGESLPNVPIVEAILARKGVGTVESSGIDGVLRLYAFKALNGGQGGTSAYVSVGIPTKIAYAGVNQTLKRNLTLLLLVILFVLAVAWFGSDLLIIRVVNALVSASRRLGAGDLSARTGLPYAHGELNQLAQAFDSMAEALQRREAERKQVEKSLEKKTAELERANQVKDEFLGVMSHELRTPLNVIVGYTAMVKERMAGEINSQQENFLGKVVSRAGDLLTMIESILYVSALEAQKIKADDHDVSLRSFLDELRADYNVTPKRNVVLTWDYPPELPTIQTDGAKLKHILQNLINNAMKFTEKGSVAVSTRVIEGAREQAGGRELGIRDQGLGVRTEARPLAPDRQWVELKVADTGIGIPQDKLPMIFDMFRQVDSSETRLYGGVGLGLYIVKKFTELVGGTIEVESEAGKGSTFTVTIPVEN
jgi:signal transduction histidine kinase